MAEPRPRVADRKLQTDSGGSLRRSFLLAAIGATVPFLALIGYLAWGQVSRERGRVERDAMAHASVLSAQVERHIGARIEGLAGAASLLAAGGVNPAAAEAQGRRLRQAFPDIERVLVVDELGAGVVAVPGLPEGRRIAVGDQDWFKRAATSTEPMVGPASLAGADVIVGLYAPVRTTEGQMRGVIALDLSLRRIQELLAQAKLGAGSVASIVTERGVIVARQPAQYLTRNVAEMQGYATLVGQGSGTGTATFEDGESRLAGAARIRPAGWVMVVGLPAADVFRDIRGHLILVALGALFVTLLAFAVALRVGSRQADGLSRLRQAMVRLQSGDLPSSLPVTVGGDAGALTDSFNRMLTWLRGKIREYEVVSQVEEAAGQVIAGDRSTDNALPGLLRRVVSGVGADIGILVLPEESGLVTRAAVGFAPGVGEGQRMRRGQGFSGLVMGERSVVVLADVEADYRVEEPYLKDGSVRSMVGVPMVAGEEVLGVVGVGYRTPHAFSPDEVQRLEAIVRRTANAIVRARALDAVQRGTEGLQAQLAEQGAALQLATASQAEAKKQVQEARKKTQELEQRIKLQAAQAPQVKEVIVEREVVRADPAAEQTTRLRAEMQKTVSEELRAPLSALLDLPRLLVEGLQRPLADAERGQLEILQERGQEILEVIEGLSVLSGLQAGRIKATKTATDLPALIQRVVRALQSRAAAKGNRIETDIKTGVGQVTTDSRRLEQVLSNLILSAIKYTEVGEVRVTVQAREREAVITVSDDGVGFTPEEQGRMFQPFLPVAPRAGRALPGTGLLLTVAEQLVAVLGGKIRAESEPDRGTWITVTLPVQG